MNEAANRTVRVGFLPLVDAALPILARELGFAEEEGLTLELVRDLSWATVSDRLIYGHTDAAHLVAPMALAATLGLGRPASPLAVPFVLGLNGNAITMRPDLAAEITEVGQPGDIAHIGQRLAQWIATHDRKLRLGVVHRYSSHNLMLRYWLMVSGIDPNDDVDITTIAPPFAAEALANGEIDGICVGEPWNSVAVERGVGVIIAVTSQIWLRGVEKVLAMRRGWMVDNSDTTERLIRALFRAGEAFVDPARSGEISSILAAPQYLDGSADLIGRAITDQLRFSQGHPIHHLPDFMFQHREAANFPWTSQAAWLYSQMCKAGFCATDAGDYCTAQAVFRPDIFRSALAPLKIALPGASAKLEGSIEGTLGIGSSHGRLFLGPDRFFDGRPFDPDDLDGYLESLPK